MCVLGCFIHLLLSATLWTDPAKFLCPSGSPGKNAGVGCHALLQRTFPPRGRTCISCNSCIAGRFFTAEPPGQPILHLMTSYMENPDVNCGSLLLEIYISLCSYTMPYVKSFPKTFKTSRVMKLSA